MQPDGRCSEINFPQRSLGVGFPSFAYSCTLGTRFPISRHCPVSSSTRDLRHISKQAWCHCSHTRWRGIHRLSPMQPAGTPLDPIS